MAVGFADLATRDDKSGGGVVSGLKARKTGTVNGGMLRYAQHDRMGGGQARVGGVAYLWGG